MVAPHVTKALDTARNARRSGIVLMVLGAAAVVLGAVVDQADAAAPLAAAALGLGAVLSLGGIMARAYLGSRYDTDG